MSRYSHHTRQGGFTLIEILIVVVILGILGAVIVPNLMSRPDQARITAAESDLRSLAAALDVYRLDNFQYPSTEQGLEALVSKPSGFPEPKNYNPDGYIAKLKTDPWGSPRDLSCEREVWSCCVLVYAIPANRRTVSTRPSLLP